MLRFFFIFVCLLISYGMQAQSNYIAKSEIENVVYEIKYNKHVVTNQKIWGEYFPFDKKIDLGIISFSKSVKIPFTKVILKNKTYTFSIIPKEYGDWKIIFTSESAEEIVYYASPFKLFNTNSETLLFYIEEPEPINGMAFIRLIGNDTQISFYLEPV